MNNNYYIVNCDDPNLEDIINVAVGDASTQRCSIDGTQMVIKLHDGDEGDYPFLDNYSPYNLEQIQEEMKTDRWTVPLF